jgi:inosine-uridine nucleoside N-ribohydrolase
LLDSDIGSDSDDAVALLLVARVPNELSALAEFNLSVEPEAASLVLVSGVPITLVPVELTLRGYLIDDDFTQLRVSNNRAPHAFAEPLDLWVTRTGK